MVIDCKAMSKAIKNEIAAGIKESGIMPGLAVVLVGDDPASKIYVRNKERACAEVGIKSEVYRIAESEATTESMLSLVHVLAARNDIHGIMVQMPVPDSIDMDIVLNAIPIWKDVDAMTDISAGRLERGKDCYAPCTPLGVLHILKESKIDLDGARVAVIGRSDIVGRPLARMLEAWGNATVTPCHSHTKAKDLKEITRNSDVVISAVGKPGFVTADMIKPGATVIDVGINRLANGKVVGDVDFENVKDVAGVITPVPGGVGVMTVTFLLWNTYCAAKMARRG